MISHGFFGSNQANLGRFKYSEFSSESADKLGIELFFDGLSLMIMTLPIVVPSVVGLGYDEVWLGVIITIMIEIKQVTPPVGLNLSVLVSVTKEKVSLGEAAIATIPY